MRGLKHKKLTIKRMILEKTGGVCAKCGRRLTLEKTTIDHFMPNRIPMCKHCKKHKGARIVELEELRYLGKLAPGMCE